MVVGNSLRIRINSFRKLERGGWLSFVFIGVGRVVWK